MMKRAMFLCYLCGGLALAAGPPRPYTIVDTGQLWCYDNRGAIDPPKPGEPFYGQDAQFQAHPASLTLSADGRTVHDNNTGLTWQRSPDTDGDGVLTGRDKLTADQARALPEKLNAAGFGGFSDWRLPSIKELYSLFDGRGTDPSGPMDADTSGLTPYLDTRFFKFAYGNVTGERVIDSQYLSSTRYAGQSPRGVGKVFGVNFADGRIKGYDLQMLGGMRSKPFFVICVRGNPAYGRNDFHDNADGTITDRATGLTWSRADSGQAMNWQAALAWVQRKNAEKYLGRDDWRLPGVKELQSIVDYSRSPDATQSPAIDPLFACTKIANEAGQADYPFYWTSTTHAGSLGGAAAMYVAFGRAPGWMSPNAMAGGPPAGRGGMGRGMRQGPQGGPGGEYHFTDVHGAGAQRSDPKDGNPALFPHGRGPQGDVIRIFNYVRLVCGGDVVKHNAAAPPSARLRAPQSNQGPMAMGAAGDRGRGGRLPPPSPLISALDLNGDGVLDASEIAKAPESLRKLDRNGDGQLTGEEYRPQFPGGLGGPGGDPGLPEGPPPRAPLGFDGPFPRGN